MNRIIKNSIGLSFVALAFLFLGALSLLPTKASAQTAYSSGYQNRINLNYNNNPSPTTYNNLVPSVSFISPNSANVGSGAQTVTVSGDGFVPTSIARWNGSDRPTTFIDASHLLVYLNANDMYGKNDHYINVWNPAPGGGYSNGVLFRITGYSTSTAPGAVTSTVQTGPNSNSGSSTNTSGSTNGNNNGNNNGNVLGAQDQNNGNLSDLTGNALFGSDGFFPTGLIGWILLAILILIIVIIVRRIYGAKKYQSTPLKHS